MGNNSMEDSGLKLFMLYVRSTHPLPSGGGFFTAHLGVESSTAYLGVDSLTRLKLRVP